MERENALNHASRNMWPNSFAKTKQLVRHKQVEMWKRILRARWWDEEESDRIRQTIRVRRNYTGRL